MAKINPGPIQIIGDASLLDTKSLAKLNAIAEEEEKIMFIDEVDRDGTQLHVVGYEEIKGIKPTKAKKSTSKPSTVKKKVTPIKKEIVQPEVSNEVSKELYPITPKDAIPPEDKPNINDETTLDANKPLF